jgi:hypothetical protein
MGPRLGLAGVALAYCAQNALAIAFQPSTIGWKAAAEKGNLVARV